MPTALLTRRVHFAAAHRYSRPDWSDARNRTVFGACANPHYHGHGYRCDVAVRGAIDDDTGMILDLGALDALLDREVRARFDHRNINLEVEEFADGALIPTGENLARVIFGRLRGALPGGVALVSVTIHEDDTLSAEYRGD
jgi:6-pyruvoyltetrahydropterin/6-carboxytetrahydropterin synthase